MSIVYERFETCGDSRVCAYCRHLHGAVFAEGRGPQPPLHDRCRCRRRFDHRVETPPSPVAPQPAPEPAPPADRSPSPAPPFPLPDPIIILDPPDDKEGDRGEGVQP